MAVTTAHEISRQVMPGPLKLLVLDDDEVDLMALQRYVKRQGLQWQLTLTQTLDEARSVIATSDFDVAIVDHRLQNGVNGLDIIPTLGDVPAILVTGVGSEDIAVQALQRRVVEYVTKDAAGQYLGHLRLAVERVVAERWTRLQSHAQILQTEIARQTAELQQKNRLLEAIVESMGEGLIAVDGTGRQLLHNTRAIELVGHASIPTDSPGADFSSMRAPRRPSEMSAHSDHPLQRALQGQVIDDERVQVRTDEPQAGERWLSVTSTQLVAARDQRDGAVIILRDVTDEVAREQAEAARRHAEEANAAKSSFLAAMSHEIRTPINGIMGVLDLLHCTDLDEEQRELLRTARRSTDNLLALLSDVLDLSKIEAGRFELEIQPFDLRELVDGVLGLFAARAQQRENALEAQFRSEPPYVFLGDAVRIRQVLTNLVSNAIKFTTRGRVSVEVLVADARAATSAVTLRVHDTGIGIPREKLDHIFDEFAQAQASRVGTGLGLSISKALVERMGGEIRVQSEPGAGSTFSVCVPLQATTIDPEQKDGSAVTAMLEMPVLAQETPERLRILVAEDNRVNQMVTRRLLENAGHCVTIVEDGAQAIEAHRRNSFDVIVMDCHMPIMDGYEATRQIRAQESDSGRVPIIAMTADATTGNRDLCMAAGMNECMTKPVRPRALYSLLSWFGRKQQLPCAP